MKEKSLAAIVWAQGDVLLFLAAIVWAQGETEVANGEICALIGRP